MNERQKLMAEFEGVQKRIAKVFAAEKLHSELMTSFGAMTMHQLGALRHVVEDGPLTMHDLAARMEIGPSAVTQLVDRLEQQGLVGRTPDAHDRRVLRVAPTEKATDAVARFKKSRRRQLTTLCERLTDDELRTLITLAERMVDVGATMEDA